jgi:hypothetical protein
MSESIKQRTGALANVSDAAELRKLLEAARSELVSLRAMGNAIYDAFTGNYLVVQPSLAIGSTAQNVANVAFYYSIGGTVYYKAAVAAGTAPGNDVVPQGKFGAVAFDIGVNGTIDAVEAPANATGYASALLAAAALPAPAADHARMGYVTATKSDGAFTFGTTALNAANSTVAYTDYLTVFNAATTVTPASPAIPEYLSE